MKRDMKAEVHFWGVSIQIGCRRFAPRRVHIQFPHLDFRSCQEQGDISAVLSGENSYRLLSVLDVHSIYLTKKQENKVELMSESPKAFYTEAGIRSITQFRN